MKDKAKERKIHEICGSVWLVLNTYCTLRGEKKIPKRERKYIYAPSMQFLLMQ